jgi:hypothetical protein
VEHTSHGDGFSNATLGVTAELEVSRGAREESRSRREKGKREERWRSKASRVEDLVTEVDELLAIDRLREEISQHFCCWSVSNLDGTELILFSEKKIFVVDVKGLLRERFLLLISLIVERLSWWITVDPTGKLSSRSLRTPSTYGIASAHATSSALVDEVVTRDCFPDLQSTVDDPVFMVDGKGGICKDSDVNRVRWFVF